MKPEIKNGILIAGNERIILAHVQKWKLDGNVVIFFMAGTQISLNLPMEAAKVDADLLAYFEKLANPLMNVNPGPDIFPAHQAPRSLEELEKERAHRAGTKERLKGLQ